MKSPSVFPLDRMSTVVPAPPLKVRPVVLKVMLVTLHFPSKHALLLVCFALRFCGLWLVWCCCLCFEDMSSLAGCEAAVCVLAPAVPMTNTAKVASVNVPVRAHRRQDFGEKGFNCM